MSIDAPAAQMKPDAAGADNFNYIDTYVEFVVEGILKYENAIPETKNRQQKEWQTQKPGELISQKIEPITITICHEKAIGSFIILSDKYAYQFIKEINPPPPKNC